MKIHASAKFTGSAIPFHNEFDLEIQKEQIKPNTDKIVNMALQKFKIKCADYFKVNFADMCFFECYYFENGKEINLFKKEKQ
jgi:hypothetical protein